MDADTSPSVAVACEDVIEAEIDVAVIGAGASGLNCARLLHAAGLRVTVLESRARIGGRIHSWYPPDGGDCIELGAQVVHGTGSPVAGLVHRLEPVARDVPACVLRNGGLTGMAQLARGGVAPWEVSTAITAAPGSLDISVAKWLAVRGADSDRTLAVAEWLAQQWAADTDDLGVMGIAAAQRQDMFGDAEFAVAGGFAELASRLAVGLDVRCGVPVRAARWSAGEVVLQTGDARSGQELRARAAVLTVPPPVVLAGRPKLELPARKLDAARALPAGDALCAVVSYERTAPGDEVVLDLDGRLGFVRCRAGTRHVSVVAKADAAAALRSLVRSPAALGAALGPALPWTASAQPLQVTVADWGRDPWTLGAFTHPRPGSDGPGAVWAEPLDNTLFFAGEATTVGSMFPWVHAALASGAKAAGQVVEVLNR